MQFPKLDRGKLGIIPAIHLIEVCRWQVLSFDKRAMKTLDVDNQKPR